MFNVVLQWTQAGFAARTVKMNAVALPDHATYLVSLTDAIQAWAMMQLSAMNPGPRVAGQGQVSYQSTTPPTPKQLQTGWTCNVAAWTPTGTTLQVTNVT
jgi:hypothetical protein